MTVVKKEGLILRGDENISLAAYIFLSIGKRGRIQTLQSRENLLIRNILKFMMIVRFKQFLETPVMKQDVGNHDKLFEKRAFV